VTSTLGLSQPRPVDLRPPTLQTIPEAIGKNIAMTRARTRSRIMAVVKQMGTCTAPSRSRGPQSPPEAPGLVETTSPQLESRQ
jgi:hypothetical protein